MFVTSNPSQLYNAFLAGTKACWILRTLYVWLHTAHTIDVQADVILFTRTCRFLVHADELRTQNVRPVLWTTGEKHARDSIGTRCRFSWSLHFAWNENANDCIKTAVLFEWLTIIRVRIELSQLACVWYESKVVGVAHAHFGRSKMECKIKAGKAIC